MGFSFSLWTVCMILWILSPSKSSLAHWVIIWLDIHFISEIQRKKETPVCKYAGMQLTINLQKKKKKKKTHYTQQK